MKQKLLFIFILDLGLNCASTAQFLVHPDYDENQFYL